MRKEFSKLALKDEMMERFRILNEDVNRKIEERPTVEYIKRVLTAYEERMDDIT
jgi:hypothetical protein